jgi:tRNA nucleotidyltransferase (CCA-adding enzyme)
MSQNYSKLIKQAFPETVFRLIIQAGELAQGMSYGTYLVGGVVRDLLLDRKNKDIDIMIEGDAIRLAELLAQTLNTGIISHKNFGTATLKAGNYGIDLATCRSEIYNRPGALPTVKFGDITADLFRRDFTINAMALCIAPGRFGDLIDLYNGREDIENKLIRVLHSESFTDDATRIMRAIRYEQRLDFEIETKTAKLLTRDLDMLDRISGDRLRKEISLWFSEPQPEKIMRRADQLAVLQKLHPGLRWNNPVNQAFSRARKHVKPASAVQLYYCLLVYSLKESELDDLLQRLNIRRGKLGNLCRQTLELKTRLALLGEKETKRADIYYLLKDFSPPAVRANALCHTSGRIRIYLDLYLDKLRFTKTLLNGRDMVRMGVPEGRLIGTVLQDLLKAKLNGEVKTRIDEEKLARSIISRLSDPGMDH